jgi:hypothetical protein
MGGLDEKLRKKGTIIIRDILQKRPDYCKVDYLSLEESTKDDLIKMVKKHHFRVSKDDDPENHRMRYIPVVDNSTDMNLMYQIKVSELKEYCELYFGFFDEEEEGIGF